MELGSDFSPTAQPQVNAPARTTAGSAPQNARDSSPGDPAPGGFQVSASALTEASTAVRTSVGEVEAKATVVSASASGIVGAAGGAKPADAIRRFLDTARHGVRAGLADQNSLAAHLRESAIAYQRCDQPIAQELTAALHAPSPASQPGTAHQQPTIPGTRDNDSSQGTRSTPGLGAGIGAFPNIGNYQRGDIFEALHPKASAEDIERFRKEGQ